MEMTTDFELNKITSAIIGSAFDVRNMYGRLMLESFYEQVMTIELKQKGFHVQTQIPIDISHREVVIPAAYRIDSLVNSTVVVEYKALPYMGGEEFRQLMTYLKITDKKVGLLINFGAKDFSFGKFENNKRTLLKGLYRIANNV